MTRQNTFDEVDELVRLHVEEGLTATKCAGELNITPQTAIKHLRRKGVYRDGRKVHLNDED